MAKGMALTIGLNAVDPKHYSGWSGELNACEADAEDMAAIATSGKFTVKSLMTKAATRVHVKAEIIKAASALKAGDIFMLSYSGHGGQLPDKNNDEPDGQDETWCLYDGELVDDELYALFSKFAKGVRVLVCSDSCHSGTVTKMAYFQGTLPARSAGLNPGGTKYRFMPPDVALRTYRQNQAFYDKLLAGSKRGDSKAKVEATVLLISGCQDNQFSADGDFNGLFTSQLLHVWKNGVFKGSYKSFHKAIVKRMPPDQTPNYYLVGEPSAAFETQRPFTV